LAFSPSYVSPLVSYCFFGLSYCF
uniref:Uncharacterized protein n=1 Tax=Amphimedon queenslandica TaxID=400682 RepID=A0A1X7SZ80_AMPQE